MKLHMFFWEDLILYIAKGYCHLSFIDNPWLRCLVLHQCGHVVFIFGWQLMNGVLPNVATKTKEKYVLPPFHMLNAQFLLIFQHWSPNTTFFSRLSTSSTIHGSPSMWLVKWKMGWLSNYGNLIILMLILVSQFKVKTCYSGTFWGMFCIILGQIFFHLNKHFEKHIKWIFNIKPPTQFLLSFKW
jgi:hypothetical protein